MQEQYADAVRKVADEVGIVGIVAILASWAEPQGGLEFVKQTVIEVDQKTVNERLDRWCWVKSLFR